MSDNKYEKPARPFELWNIGNYNLINESHWWVRFGGERISFPAVARGPSDTPCILRDFSP